MDEHQQQLREFVEDLKKLQAEIKRANDSFIFRVRCPEGCFAGEQKGGPWDKLPYALSEAEIAVRELIELNS